MMVLGREISGISSIPYLFVFVLSSGAIMTPPKSNDHLPMSYFTQNMSCWILSAIPSNATIHDIYKCHYHLTWMEKVHSRELSFNVADEDSVYIEEPGTHMRNSFCFNLSRSWVYNLCQSSYMLHVGCLPATVHKTTNINQRSSELIHSLSSVHMIYFVHDSEIFKLPYQWSG
jgi:hypothetical protein